MFYKNSTIQKPKVASNEAEKIEFTRQLERAKNNPVAVNLLAKQFYEEIE